MKWTDKAWTDDTRQRFVAITMRRGIEKMAKELPASISTVYRLVNGEVRKPTLAVRVAVERIVNEGEKKP